MHTTYTAKQLMSFYFNLGEYYVDITSSDWNAFWFWSNHVRYE